MISDFGFEICDIMATSEVRGIELMAQMGNTGYSIVRKQLPFWTLAFVVCSFSLTDENALAASKEQKKNKRETMPFTVAENLFDHKDLDRRGLERAPGTETFTIFAPDKAKRGEPDARCSNLPFCPGFNHGVRLRPYKDKLIATRQACPQHEDSADGIIVCSESDDDGVTWSKPQKIRDAVHAEKSGEVKPSAAAPAIAHPWQLKSWDGNTYVQFKNRYFGKGYAFSGPGPRRTEYSVSKDGKTWAKPQFLLDDQGQAIDGYVHPNYRFENGRLLAVDARLTEGDRIVPAMLYTDDPRGITGWKRAEWQTLPGGPKNIGRECESSKFTRAGGALVVVSRDLGGSYRILATVSTDHGESWSPTVITDMPDSNSMQCAGNLPDGTAFLVNNPSTARIETEGFFPNVGWKDKSGRRERIPLSVTLSRDGKHFDRAFLLRGGDDLQRIRYPGRHKLSGFSYPGALVHNGYLYISYAANKEDAQLTRVPLESLDAAGDSTSTQQ